MNLFHSRFQPAGGTLGVFPHVFQAVFYLLCWSLKNKAATCTTELMRAVNCRLHLLCFFRWNSKCFIFIETDIKYHYKSLKMWSIFFTVFNIYSYLLTTYANLTPDMPYILSVNGYSLVSHSAKILVPSSSNSVFDLVKYCCSVLVCLVSCLAISKLSDCSSNIVVKIKCSPYTWEMPACSHCDEQR